MQVVLANDVQVFNLSVSRALPEWLSDRKRRQLRKKEPELRRRIELIQDLDMPTVSTYVAASPDQKYLYTLGVYKPRIRCYELANLALKFERCLDNQAHKILFLEEDYTKLVLLEDDRWIDFHSREGNHFKTRIPRPGRDIAFSPSTCDLFVVGESDEVYRINLSQGRFLAPFKSSAPSLTCCAFCVENSLLLCGTEDGRVEGWDPRARRKVATLDFAGIDVTADQNQILSAITTLTFRDPINIGFGTNKGICHLFDIRQQKPWLSKDHGYGFPIRSMVFHEDDKVLSIDKRCLKIWSQEDGQTWTGFEPGEELNHLHHFPGSGLFMIANESPKVLTYFVPMLGDAPSWCPQLDRLVDEVEPEQANVYDDYKFLTRQELDTLGLTHLIGSEFLRAYMHGYFIDARLYAKAKSAIGPQSLNDHRKIQVQKMMEDMHKSRLVSADDLDENPLPAVNPDLADKVQDSRFAEIFEDVEFTIDPADEESTLLDLAQRRADKKERRKMMKREKAAKSLQLVQGENFEDDDESMDDV